MPDLSEFRVLYWVLGIPMIYLVYRVQRLPLEITGANYESVNNAVSIIALIGVFLCWPLHVFFQLWHLKQIGWKAYKTKVMAD